MAAVTRYAALASSTGLPFAPTPLSFTNGGLRVALHTTGALPEPVASDTSENADIPVG